MKTVRMLIGLPRSGKSTYTEEMKNGAVVLSADRLRLLLYGQRFYRGGEAVMWSFHDIVYKLMLEQGIDIIIDETNVMASRRKYYIDLAKEYGYTINGIWFKTSVEECCQRAINTNQQDLIPVIHQMNGKFVTPEIEEGFGYIETIEQGE